MNTYFQKHLSMTVSETVWLYLLRIHFKVRGISFFLQNQSLLKIKILQGGMLLSMHVCRYSTSIAVRYGILINFIRPMKEHILSKTWRRTE